MKRVWLCPNRSSAKSAHLAFSTGDGATGSVGRYGNRRAHLTAARDTTNAAKKRRVRAVTRELGEKQVKRVQADDGRAGDPVSDGMDPIPRAATHAVVSRALSEVECELVRSSPAVGRTRILAARGRSRLFPSRRR